MLSFHSPDNIIRQSYLYFVKYNKKIEELVNYKNIKRKWYPNHLSHHFDQMGELTFPSPVVVDGYGGTVANSEIDTYRLRMFLFRYTDGSKVKWNELFFG